MDLLIIATVSLAVFAPRAVGADDTSEVSAWTQVALIAIWVAYEAGTTAWLGTTLGKMATGCRVVSRRTGKRPNLAQAVARAVLVPGALSVVAAFALLLYPTALLDRTERRGVLDRLSGTVVVRANTGEQTSGRNVEDLNPG